MDGRRERKDCLFCLEMEVWGGKDRKKSTVCVAGGGFYICADEPEMTFACRRYRNRFIQSVGMNVQGEGKCQSICSSVHFRVSGRLKSELHLS